MCRVQGIQQNVDVHWSCCEFEQALRALQCTLDLETIQTLSVDMKEGFKAHFPVYHCDTNEQRTVTTPA